MFRGSLLLLLIKDHSFAKKELKSLSFLLKFVTYSFSLKRGRMMGIFLLLKFFLIIFNKRFYFFVYKLIYMLLGNNNLVWKLQLFYVGLFVEFSISSSNLCCCFYYFNSFYKHCFSLG